LQRAFILRQPRGITRFCPWAGDFLTADFRSRKAAGHPGTPIASGQERRYLVNVLLAIDHSSCSDAAVDAVCAQFRPADSVVRVVHVVEWPRDLPAAHTFAEGPAAADSILATEENIRQQGRELVEHAVARLRAAQFDATGVVVEGDVRHVILELAAEWPADTIVLGSHGRKGLERLLLGSVSYNVVRHAPCSVEVVRAR
jgi:nucleotide-binding universal stress UspA family protein